MNNVVRVQSGQSASSSQKSIYGLRSGPLPSRLGAVKKSARCIETHARSPKHLKYLKRQSKEEVEEEYMREWMEVAGMTLKRGPMNIFSIITFALGWVKYNIIPEPIRFVWWLVWLQLSALLRKVQWQLTLVGARIDALLSRGRGFSRAEALRRWHLKVSPLDLVVYRVKLAVTGKLPQHSRAKGEAPPASGEARPIAPRA